MSSLRRVLLLLSIAVLLREGSSNSPLDFFRDLKNRIFSSGNSTESFEEPSQCSEVDQDGVCAHKTAGNYSLDNDNLTSTETFDNHDFNGTLTDTEASATDQTFLDEAVNAETDKTNNTVYYDEQEWNSTATNNTENLGNDFEYQEFEQNATSLNRENNKQLDNFRPKRQIKKIGINITLKTPKVTSTLLTLSTGKSAKFTDSSMNVSLTTEQHKEVFANVSESNWSGFKNESEIINENQAVDVNSSNETKENIMRDEEKTNQPTNTTLGSLESIVISNVNYTSNIPESQNTTGEKHINEHTINCTACDVMEEKTMTSQNVPLNLGEINETQSTKTDTGNSTETNDDDVIDQTNVRQLVDILINSTRILKKIKQNIIPASIVNGLNNNTETLLRLLLNQANEELDQIKRNITELKDENIIFDNSTVNITYMTHEDNLRGVDSMEFERNISDQRVKREKRSINFTILSDDDDSDLSRSTFPDTTEMSASETLNSTDPSLPNDAQSVETVGPVCLSRYDECTHSSDCCEPYQCISTEGPNSTFHCDQPVSNPISTSTSTPQNR